jgi:large subunit ribosomal protein L28
MTWKCDLIESFSKQKGNKVSHSNRKKIKHFKTNLQQMVFFSETLQKKFSLKVAVKTNRTIVKCGGFDEFLLSRPGCPAGSNMARSNILTAFGLKLRRMIKKKKLAIVEVSNQN